MTIAELLVQTTATLLAAEAVAMNLSTTDLHPPDYATVARAIVAAVYGEPCGEFAVYRYYVSNRRDLGGDPCECGWPRSQHGAMP